ncbi:hypothetical protein EDB19DRAFT_1954115 [Suillus lakei]|nr:hypothetical protein EDB19DRAFT_1954115 [Suillus lakei]
MTYKTPVTFQLLCALLTFRLARTMPSFSDRLKCLQLKGNHVKNLSLLPPKRRLLIPLNNWTVANSQCSISFHQYFPLTGHMPPDIIHVDPETILRVYQSGQPVILGSPVDYMWKERPVQCPLICEDTALLVQDSTSIICTWGGCSKILKKGSMTRHLLTHLGVKCPLFWVVWKGR